MSSCNKGSWDALAPERVEGTCPCFWPSRQKKKTKQNIWGCFLSDSWLPHICVRLIIHSHTVPVWRVSVTSVCMLLLLNLEIMSAGRSEESLCQSRGNYCFSAYKEKGGVGWLKGYNGLLYKRAFYCFKWTSQPELIISWEKSSVTLWSSAIIALKSLWGDIPYEQRAVGVDIHPSSEVSLQWIRCLLTSEVERESLRRTAPSSF